jgi:hypothetical protein
MKLSEYRALMLIIEAKIRTKTSNTFHGRINYDELSQNLEKEFIKKYIEKENEDGRKNL